MFIPRLKVASSLACVAALSTQLLSSWNLSAGAPTPQPKLQPSSPNTSSPQRSPQDWAVLATKNELSVLAHEGSYLRYRTHIINQKGDRVRDVVESKDGSIARTLMEGGKPLSPEASDAERKRLEDLASSPDAFAKHIKEDVSGRKLAADLIRLMPVAMIYTLAPGQGEARSLSGNRLIVLDFEPNPKWNPPTTPSQALTGFRGRIWIDEATGFVTHVDGEIFRSVNIGWGMVAHVYPGGKLSFEQVDVGNNRWIYSHFIDQARVRALMLKTLDISTEITASDFQPLPAPLTFQQAIALLLK